MNGRVHELSYLGYYLGQVCIWYRLLINPFSSVLTSLTFVAVLNYDLDGLMTEYKNQTNRIANQK